MTVSDDARLFRVGKHVLCPAERLMQKRMPPPGLLKAFSKRFECIFSLFERSMWTSTSCWLACCAARRNYARVSNGRTLPICLPTPSSLRFAPGPDRIIYLKSIQFAHHTKQNTSLAFSRRTIHFRHIKGVFACFSDVTNRRTTQLNRCNEANTV